MIDWILMHPFRAILWTATLMLCTVNFFTHTTRFDYPYSNQDDLTEALYIAADLTGRKVVEGPPPASLVYSRLRFVAKACPNNRFSCTAAAVYSPFDKTITISGPYFDQISHTEQMALLIHEMVHHLQGEVIYDKKTCPRIELEAYKAQQKYLQNHGLELSNYSINVSIQTTCDALRF